MEFIRRNWYFLIIPIIILLWLLNITILGYFSRFNNMQFTESYGHIGDMFGVVNSLFSGLAFLGIIYTIIKQREDAKDQRKETIISRNIDIVIQHTNSINLIVDRQTLNLQSASGMFEKGPMEFKGIEGIKKYNEIFQGFNNLTNLEEETHYKTCLLTNSKVIFEILITIRKAAKLIHLTTNNELLNQEDKNIIYQVFEFYIDFELKTFILSTHTIVTEYLQKLINNQKSYETKVFNSEDHKLYDINSVINDCYESLEEINNKLGSRNGIIHDDEVDFIIHPKFGLSFEQNL